MRQESKVLQFKVTLNKSGAAGASRPWAARQERPIRRLAHGVGAHRQGSARVARSAIARERLSAHKIHRREACRLGNDGVYFTHPILRTTYPIELEWNFVVQGLRRLLL